MNALAVITDGYGRWIDTVSNTIADSLAGFSSPRVVTLVEDESGVLVLSENGQPLPGVLQSGQLRLTEDGLIDTGTPPGATDLSGWHVELVLQPERFLVRPLELPARAAEFLDGVVRAQIDRLTPWDAGDATFGWSVPVPQDDGRIVITVAAAAKQSIAPYAQGLADLGASSIAVFVQLSNEEGNDRIKVLDQRPGTIIDARRLRHLLSTGLVAATIVATLSIGAMWLADSYVGARQDDIARKIGSARAALMASGKSGFEPHRILERRKHDVAPSVIVLDAVSQILPDDTYVTALEIEGDKVRISGLTRDAPPLIGLMERSNRFARATFFAPTTRSPSDQGERFHIEANIQPLQPSP
ncbi:MAG TPA: PilN domain-containing protein [Xanthobacteraceae bacterium]|nr:PilN domain-containing protein [Xanthobacteraceae bacterium]